MVVSLAAQTLKLCRRMCLMCAAVAHASKENQLCATRLDCDVVILPSQSEKIFCHRPTNSNNLDAIAPSDICLVERTDTLKETSGFEKRQVATCRISHLLSNSDVTRSKTIRLSQGCLDKDRFLNGGRGVESLQCR